MRQLKMFAAALLLAACQTAAPAPSYRLVDLTDEYAALYDRTEGSAPEARVAAFNAEIAPLFPAFYRPGRPGAPSTQDGFDRRVTRSFERFAANRGAYARTAADFTAMLAPALVSFQRAFPDATAFGDIYLIHSLGEMDGGMREVDGALYLIFGADVISQAHPPGQERPFFHHELFHAYQQRSFRGCAEIWCGLWQEGLAVAAAEELNPGATDAQLLFTQPEPIRAAVEANLREAVCVVRARLDSTSGDDWSALFSSGRLNERLPPRFAYYVGYLVAREARQARSLQDLARLNLAHARPVVEAALARLADCGTN